MNETQHPDFVVMPPTELLRRLQSIHGTQKKIQSYLWVAKAKRCWETRGLAREEQRSVVQGTYRDRNRDLSCFLNDWSPIERINSVPGGGA